MSKQITKAIEDYIEAIYILEKDSSSIKSIDISKLLNVSKPAVAKITNELKQLELISKDHYGEISLTEKGRSLAIKVYEKHIEIRTFLIKLGVSEEIAELDCCKIEHILSDETLKKIIEFNNK